ncbi:TPA: hypothetical protein ACH3X1_001758 [Trebouxia sp. C0004]
MVQIEPASLSGAEALAEIVTLRMQYEPVDDEITLAAVKWCVGRLHVAGGGTARLDKWSRGRTSVSSAPRRYCSKEKITSESGLEKAIEELSTKLKHWGAAVHGQVQYLLCYACAGSQFQICAIRRGSSVAYRFRRHCL